MKIALIRYHDSGDVNTRLPESLNKVRGIMPPLGICYIASTLEQAGYDVTIFDAMALNITGNELLARLQAYQPDIIGVTSMISNIHGALEALKIGKSCNAVTVIGGPLMATYPKETLTYDFIDYAIIGEGEQPMLELVRALEQKTCPQSIQGLVYKADGLIHVNEPSIEMDLDALPFPSRHLLPTEKYSSLISLYPMTTMIATRGCPFKCGFCIKSPSDKKCRHRSPANVVDEMEHVVKKYKVKEIMFYDDTLTVHKKFIMGMCDEIIKRKLKIKWECPSRVDTVTFEMLKKMKQAGCIKIRFGVESGDPEILSLMQKGIDLDRIKQVFKWAAQLKLETFAYFMLGYIYETPQTMMNTINLAQELNPDYVMFTIATPYPQTPLFELAEKEGLVDKNYWEEFVLGKRNDQLQYLVDDAEQWLHIAYKKFYFRIPYILKRLTKLTSISSIKNHFFSLRALLGFEVRN